jgi:hypothetical protein
VVRTTAAASAKSMRDALATSPPRVLLLSVASFDDGGVAVCEDVLS